MKYQVLYNPKAGNGTGETETKNIEKYLPGGEIVYYDLTQNNTAELIAKFPLCDKIVISDGDGTLNRFINDTADMEILHDVYYFATGSGNDFIHDLGGNKDDAPVLINEYIKDLPKLRSTAKLINSLTG